MSFYSARRAFALRLNNKLFYGWPMLAIAALGLFASGPGQSHTFSVFMGSFISDLGLSQTWVALAYTCATLLAAAALPLFGHLIDRHGARIMLTAVALFLGIACALFSQVSNVAELTAGITALRFLGQGALMLCCANLMAQWFARKRGLALGVMALGFALSMSLHPYLAQVLISLTGWREAWVWLGAASALLIVPLAFFFVFDKPEELGMAPDGELRNAYRDSLLADAEVGLTLKEATRTGAFWIIALTLATLSMLVTAIFLFQVSVLTHQGLETGTATQLFTVTAITMVIFLPIAGRMLDLFPTRAMLVGTLALLSATLVCMSAAADFNSALLYSIVFGLCNAFLHTSIAYVWPRFFGRKHLGSIQGAGKTAGILGAALGSLPLGVAYDKVGGYGEMLLTLSTLPLVCAVAVSFMRPPPIDAQNYAER